MHRLMKTSDDEYVVWSTNVDEVIDGPFTREEAIAYACETAPEGVAADAALLIAEERLRFTDQHLCSCRARLGERWVKRNGRTLPVGGGRLAYHFDTYEQVARFMADHRQEA
jgi:predicted solute-binding protein